MMSAISNEVEVFREAFGRRAVLMDLTEASMGSSVAVMGIDPLFVRIVSDRGLVSFELSTDCSNWLEAELLLQAVLNELRPIESGGICRVIAAHKEVISQALSDEYPAVVQKVEALRRERTSVLAKRLTT